MYIGERKVSGWSSVRVTRGVERLVSDFEVGLTERYPGTGPILITPGDICQILLGNDHVITGYIDDYAPQIDANNHTIRVSGRSKTQDLVDCSAVWPGSQLVHGTVLSIAQTLAARFGISVTSIAADVGPLVPQTILNWGDTPFDILEPLARLRALLMYDDPQGNLVFADANSILAGSGFAEGVNIEAASVNYSMRDRYSTYRVYRVKMSAFKDSGDEAAFAAEFKDPTVPRYRPKFIIAETNDGGNDVALKRAQWSLARGVGRSAAVHLVTDSWRDADGTLWTPNTLANVEIPSLKLGPVTWLISEVTYIRDAQGTHAHIVMMHPDAFKPQPINYQPIPQGLQKAIEQATSEIPK
jgi:prophage tail gpP-like protein